MPNKSLKLRRCSNYRKSNYRESTVSFLDDNLNEECEQFSYSKSSASGCCLVFA